MSLLFVIEKEALVVTWACEKLLDYILGRKFELETDHKPLIPLLSKQLDLMPPRILRFRLRLSKFDYTISHVPGKFIYTADALSRAPMEGIGKEAVLQDEAEAAMVDAVVQSLPTSPERLRVYQQSQTEDTVCQQLISLCRNGWPSKKDIDPEIQPYLKYQAHITENEGVNV